MFGLNNVKVKQLDTDSLSKTDLANPNSVATLNNVRLWDPSVLSAQINAAAIVLLVLRVQEHCGRSVRDRFRTARARAGFAT